MRDPLALAGRQRGAAFADHRRVALRQPRDEGVERRAARRRDRIAVDGVGPGVADVLGDRRVQNNGSCSTSTTCRRRSASAHVAQIAAVEPHRAASGSSSRSSRSAIVDLPLPLGPTIASTSPGATANDTDRAPDAAVECERDVVERDRRRATSATRSAPARSTHFGGVSSISCTRRHDTCAVARLAYSPISACDRRQHAHLVRHERDERAERQRAVDRRAGRRRRTRRAVPIDSSRPGSPPDRYDSRCIDISASMNASFRRAERARPRAACALRRHDQPHRLQRLDQKAADVGARCAQRRRLRSRAAPRYTHQRPRRRAARSPRRRRNSRESSHTIMTTLPTRNSTLPTHASAVSAATR